MARLANRFGWLVLAAVAVTFAVMPFALILGARP